MSLPYNRNLIPNAKNLRKNPTPWEKKLWYTFLRNYPIRFQRQKTIGNYIVDFYCAKAKLVIELDGSGHFTPETIQYDQQRSNYLQQQGLQVIRFTNKQINENFKDICNTIDETVNQRLKNQTETTK